MSFRDSVVQEDSSSSGQPEFHPVRDLIDSIRSNKEQRRQARQDRKEERREQAHMSRNQRNMPDSPEGDRANSPIQLSDNIPRPMPDRQLQYPGTPGTRGAETPMPPIRFAAYEKEAPLAKPAAPLAKPAEQTRVAETEPVNGRLLPDTITVKERNGAVAELPEDKRVSADERLNGYLQARGAQVSELDLNCSSVSDKGLALLNKAPNLSKLMLNDTDVSNDSMKVLAQQGLRNLKELNLHSTRVGDEGIAQLKGMPLQVLNIADTATSDDCMQHVKTMRNLQVLNADYSGVGNEGVKAFKDMPNLRSVSLKGCPITDDCVKDLSQSQNLMLLNLEDTKLSSDKVIWLQRHMPRCVIIPPDGQGAAQGLHHHRKSSGILQRLFEPSPRH